MKNIKTLLGLLLVALILVSCGGGGGGGGGGGASAPAASNSLIGTWYGRDSAGWFSSSGNYYLEFTFDGTNLSVKSFANNGTTVPEDTATVPYTDSGSSFSFNTAEMVFTTSVSGTVTGATHIVSYDYSISGNNLTVSNCKYDGVLRSPASVVMTRR